MMEQHETSDETSLDDLVSAVVSSGVLGNDAEARVTRCLAELMWSGATEAAKPYDHAPQWHREEAVTALVVATYALLLQRDPIAVLSRYLDGSN